MKAYWSLIIGHFPFFISSDLAHSQLELKVVAWSQASIAEPAAKRLQQAIDVGILCAVASHTGSVMENDQ